MKRLNLFVIMLAYPMMMFGQLNVESNGDVLIGSSLGTDADVPVVFKVNNNLAGSTGNSSGSNVSFGYGALLSPAGGENTAIDEIQKSDNADASISIELFNNFGQRVNLIASKQNKNAGTYSVQTSVTDLETGTYIVKVTSDSQIESKQLIINN